MKKETPKLNLSKNTLTSIKTNVKAGGTKTVNCPGRCDGGLSY